MAPALAPFPCLVLASTSPRRIELMSQVGLKFETLSPHADESPVRGESPFEMVARLSRLKAETAVGPVARKHKSAIIIAADTIVVAPDGKRVYGKPVNIAEAKRMLRQLAGRTHTVLTGYCILELSESAKASAAQELIRVITSKVTFRKLSQRDIANYVASGEPMDKAGAYAAQGLGTALIERIDGSYTNVVGLPMAQLLADLEHEFGVPIFVPSVARRRSRLRKRK